MKSNIIDKDLYFMDIAFNEAKKAYSLMEVPIGAIIVKDNEIIGAGYNKKEIEKSPLCHAEIEAIDSACKNIGDWRLNGATMYVTMEPCIMCAGAILQARIDRVCFGIIEHKFGGVISLANVFDIEKSNHKVRYDYGIMSEEISNMMKRFFKELREMKK